MDRRRIGELQIISFLFFIDDFPVIEADCDALVCHRPDNADITIIDTLVIVIPLLHDLVADKEMIPRWDLLLMHQLLNGMIQIVYPAPVTIHGGKHLQCHFLLALPIVQRAAKAYDRIEGFLFRPDRKDLEFPAFVRDTHIPFPDERRILDDAAPFFLTKNMLEPCDRHLFPGDDRFQGRTRSYRRELVDIADQNEACIFFQRRQ